MAEQIKIGGRLHSIAEGNVVTGANEILDDSKGKKQSVVNQETDAELERLNNAKQDNLTFDTTPTEGSTNPITSGGVYAADEVLQQAIAAILLLIPSAASALNQLADKNFVNSTVATDSATFRGTYNVVTDLELHYDATHQQIATALLSKIQTADNNDYCFVQIPVSDSSGDIRVTERYKFNGTVWSYEYDLNNSGFTAAQWAAINSTITQALVEKLGALPTAAELAIALNGKQNTLTFDTAPVAGSNNPVTSAGLYAAFQAINATIPAGASADNKLVAETRLAEYVAAIINALDATYNVTSTDGHVNVRLTQVDGVITSLEVLTSDIASDADVTALTTRVSTNEGDIALLQDAYEALTQSTPVIVEPTDTWPVAVPQEGVIYRVIDRVNTPPQNYSDYMYNGTVMVLMATYDNAIDDIPTPGSNNLVKSGGVASHIVYDISEANAVGSTLATYADLAAALGNNGANIPPSIQKGGMSVKFIQSSDNKYVQYFCNSQTFTIDVNAWERMNLEDEVLNSSIYFKDFIPDANKRITELYLVGLDVTKRYYFKYLGQYYNGSNYSEIHLVLCEFIQPDKSDEQIVCGFIKTGTEPLSAKGIIKLTESNSSGVYGWAIINIPSDIRNDVRPEIDINICSNILNSPVLAGISPATESSTIKTTDGVVIANINGVNLYSGLPYVSRLSGGNERVRELYITGNINNAHTYRLLTFSSGAYVGVNLYDQTDNNKLVALGYKTVTSYEGIIELTENNSSGISAYAFVNVGLEAPQIYGVVDLILATDLGANPIIKSMLGENIEDFFKYRKADVTVSLYAANKYINPTDGSLTNNNALSVIKVSGNGLLNKLTLLNIYTQGEGICGIGAYKSDDSFIKSIFTLPSTPLGKYNYYIDLTTQDLSIVDYILLTVDKRQVLGEIICLVEQFNRGDYYFYSENNRTQEIKENHIYLKADGTTPKLSETLLGITDSGYYNRYFIHLSNGIYDILDGISHVEDPATNPYGDGVWVKDYVSIIGDGEIENTIIKCELDPSVDTQTTTQDGYTISIMEKISTINASSNSKIENVTITAKNCRYAIHSDYSYYQTEDTELIFKNCKIIHYGDTAGWPVSRQVSVPACYGGGIRNGQKRIFKNCDFIAYQSTPWFTHNASTMDKDAFIELNGCKFINLTENITLDSAKFPSVTFASYGVTANVHTKIVGCLINNSIKLQENTLSGHTTKGTDYVLIGNGNNVPVQYEEKTSTNVPRNKYCVKFSDEGIYCMNRTSSLIPLGTALKMNDNGSIVPLSIGDENLFIGFANEDIGVDEIGYIKTKGFYSLKDLGISAGNWAVGTRFKLNGSSIVQDNTGNLIVKTYGYLYL